MALTANKAPGKGGKRPGAGRPKGSPNKLREPQRQLMAAAQDHSEDALSVLVDLMHGEHFVYERNEKTGRKIKKPLPVSDSVRKSAAEAILDRGHGKPRQTHEDTTPTIDVSKLSDAEAIEYYRLTCLIHGEEPNEIPSILLDGSPAPGGNGAAKRNGSH